jgi:Dyp-type peroxidase family
MARARIPLHLLTRPLTEADLKVFHRPLANLQGNILKGHGRDHTVHVFLEFRAGKRAAAKKWLAGFAAEVTSMTRQREEQQEYSAYQIPGTLFRAIYLSAAGYSHLGFDVRKFDRRFQAGMKKSRARLADPDINEWEKPYRGAIDAMILLADDGDTFIGRAARELVNQIKGGNFARVLAIERGSAQRNQDDQAIEHFGYADGRSQPVMFEADIRKELKREGIQTFAHWSPEAGPNLVLRQDPFGGENAFGSYFVYRKLEQNVRGFKRREKELAVALGLMGPQGELGGAMAMGRFANGNPVVLDNEDELPPGHIVRNDFNYKTDPHGAKCPFQGHIRKMNPRGSSGEPPVEERMHRLARRGITYGDRTKESFENEDLMPEKNVGLLFMCFQADLARQFEFVQAKWGTNSNFPGARTGLDPVIGRGGTYGQQWPPAWGNPDPALRQPFDFAGFVTLKGGEYFFAPSISFLAGLGAK